MSERYYLLLVGSYILCALYIEIDMMIYILSAFLIFEGITNLRLTTALQKVRNISLEPGLVKFRTKTRFDLDALQAWRVMVAVVMVSSYILLHEYEVQYLWFFPWFMGFAILGAGASGMCPMFIGLRWAGFR